MTNPWCEILGIEVPRVEAVTDHREASAYTLLIVTLLERGAPMTLPEVAARLEIAGVGAAADALAALVRCRPGRAPVYCDGDRYGLDPHDADLDLWAFRLGLRPPDSPPIGRFKPNPEPVPEPDVALTVSELDEAWKDANLASWSAQRLALAVLDAAGRPMAGHEVVAFVKARAPCHALRDDGRGFARRGSAVEILPDGRWSVAAGAGAAVEATRRAVRARVVVARRYARVDPAVIAAHQEQGERMRAAHAAALSKLRRGLVYALGTAKRPDAVAVVDIEAHTVTTFVGDELAGVAQRLATFDVIGAMEVRAVLRGLDFDPGARQLVELGPPQKTITVDKRGRTVKLTTAMLITGSCGINKPLGDDAKLAGWVARGEHGKLRRGMEANAKSLYALYQYGRLHGAVRVRCGSVDVPLGVPWLHRDELTLGGLIRAAFDAAVPLEVVVGAAPAWEDPWARGDLAFVEADAEYRWRKWLLDVEGGIIDVAEVQMARLFVPHLDA